MKRLALALTLMFCVAGSAFSQAVPSVKIKLKERSGLFGIGGPRNIFMDLSNAQQSSPLNDVNVNGGEYYYFLIRPVEDWTIDEDFLKTDLPRITLTQNGERFQIVWKAPLAQEKVKSILIGFDKRLRLFQPFILTIQIDKVQATAEFIIPMELWPNYTEFTNLLAQADLLFRQRGFRESIPLYEKIMNVRAFNIFPDYTTLIQRRTNAFDQYVSARSLDYHALVHDQIFPLKQKIGALGKIVPDLQFAIDSLAKLSLGVTGLDPAEKSVTDKAALAINNIAVSRDSLQRVLDDENVRWINEEGSAIGKNAQNYKAIIEILAHAFSTMNFFDTTAISINVKLDDDQQLLLSRNKLEEPYETFLRQTEERFAKRMAMFQLNFLMNLQRDTAHFSLPYYSMLKAVNDYYLNNFSSARREINRVFQKSYNSKLNERFDMMRIAINMRTEGYPAEAMRLIQEADEAEKNGDINTALQRYSQANAMAPGFPYAAYMLGRFYGRTNDGIRAGTFLQSAFRIDTLFLSAYREAVLLYRQTGNWTPVIEMLTRAMETGNDNWEINTYLGEAYMGLGDPIRASQYFERALEWNAKSYSSNLMAGQAFQAMKDYNRARDFYNRAISLEPSRMEAIDYMTRMMEEQRNALRN